MDFTPSKFTYPYEVLSNLKMKPWGDVCYIIYGNFLEICDGGNAIFPYHHLSYKLGDTWLIFGQVLKGPNKKGLLSGKMKSNFLKYFSKRA